MAEFLLKNQRIAQNQLTLCSNLRVSVHERWVVENLFITYVCYAPDVLF